MMPVEFHLVLTSLMRMRHWSSGVPDTYIHSYYYYATYQKKG